MKDGKPENLGEATLGLDINSEKFDKKMKEAETRLGKFENITRDKVQGFRDMVRPTLTLMVAASYYITIFIATWNKLISGKEAIVAVTVPFMMMMTYHFSKSSQKDSNPA